MAKKTKKKPFTVTVTAAKYNGWRSGELYQKLGGLYGLCIGADRVRRIKTTVKIKDWVPWLVMEEVINTLERYDFEIVTPGVIRAESPYWSKHATKEAVVHLSSYDKEEQKKEAKELCKEVKKETEEIVQEIFDDIGEFEPED